MKESRTGVLLVNLGTPDSPNTGDVRRYLREFLMDERVIDIPALSRWMLINLIIAPFRAPKSSAEYKKVWTDEGSPLLIYGERVEQLLQEALGEKYMVKLAMRYQNPSVRSVLDQMEGQGLDSIIVIPMYPQYASASSGSSIEKVMQEMKHWAILPEVHVVSNFPIYEPFIKAFTEIGKSYLAKHDYDHVVFTYHGIPERHVLKGSINDFCQLCDDCCGVSSPDNAHCYRGNCFATTRALVKALELEEGSYTVCFQSRLGKTPWIKPYTDEVLVELAKKGVKRVLAFSPSFVADCLETTIEVGEEYHEDFIEAGGERWDLVESLNDHPLWIEALKQMVHDQQAKAAGVPA